MNNFLIGCVGKPSAGKSSFLNAATDANAKVGNYPFTTIDPNNGVTFYQSPCPCKKYGKTDVCAPRYGKCVDGTRFIPVKMLDVAGLVPGASEGRGLGNKFLDDLRTAHVLLHIVDASGQTNEKGEGYDPINDIQWLLDEIHSWIFNNLWKKWGSIVRRHSALKAAAATTLQLQFSGYGSNFATVQKALDLMGIKEPSEMEKWDKEYVGKVVRGFMDVRFPTVIVLNKIDQPDADGNILRICQKYDPNQIVLTSALAECFLRKMNKDKYIRYTEGSEFFDTSEDQTTPDPDHPLKDCDEKLMNRLEKVRDLVLFRYGSTGIQAAIKKAVDMKGLVPVYPVRNLTHFSSDDKNRGSFKDCLLVSPGTTVREFCRLLSPELEKHFLYAEGPSGQRTVG
ncbi:hypothetical protein PROFUN_01286 [Planoprotostelium fungivorum]|uniref:OBG-type G domain-containing protein n=1 Tax=Planoprotostelium fungivorum TaxID=1890364 RepID=A0A2P6NZM6_9EUKA|nr:hypothetical protein PROFUN_01286 [Planoprotostelium fungivorum]